MHPGLIVGIGPAKQKMTVAVRGGEDRKAAPAVDLAMSRAGLEALGRQRRGGDRLSA